MSDTPTQEQPPQGAPQQAARRRERAPKSADAKQRGLAARKLQRALKTVQASKDAAKMEQAAVLLAQLQGEATPKEGAAPRAEQPPPAEPPKQLSAVPATADATKPGWPSEAALADAAPTVKELVDVGAVFLAGTRFDLCKTVPVRVGEKIVERTKAEVLAEKLTPLAAKYGASFAETPEAVAIVGLVTVFGQPLVEMALAKVLAKQQGAHLAEAA